MREESQLEEMRQALRGERERARRSRPKFLESLTGDKAPQPVDAQPEERKRTIRTLFRRG